MPSHAPADDPLPVPPPGGWPVRIEPLGRSALAGPGQSVWEAATAAGIAMPVSCRNGTCRTCLCRVTAGRVTYRTAWPGLSAEEKADGWTLACVAVPCSPLTIESPRSRGCAA